MIDNENTPQPLAEIPIGPSAFDQFMDRNQRLLIILAILVILAGAGIIVHKSLKEDAEARASAALIVSYNEVTGQYDTGSLEKVMAEHAGTAAAVTAGYLYAEALWEAGDTDKSMQAFEKFIQENSSGDLHDKAVLVMAIQLHQNNEAEKAMEAYRTVIDTQNQVYSPIALLNMGDLYRASGDIDKAKFCYEEVMQKYSNTQFGFTHEIMPSPAKKRLELLGIESPELKQPQTNPLDSRIIAPNEVTQPGSLSVPAPLN